jgi:hypothetical protein
VNEFLGPKLGQRLLSGVAFGVFAMIPANILFGGGAATYVWIAVTICVASALGVGKG